MHICTDDFIDGMTKTILAPLSEMNPFPFALQRETSRLDIELANCDQYLVIPASREI